MMPAGINKQVMSAGPSQPQESPNPYDSLFSSDLEDEEIVKQIVVTDKGSKA